MKEFSNELSNAELERLAILSEEMSEVNKIICKIIRYGYESCNPKTKETNRILLEKELGDVVNAFNMMEESNDISRMTVNLYAGYKSEKIKTYLHFQEKPIDKSLHVGDYVKYNHENGSTGIIKACHPSVKDLFYVEYIYGMDINGSPIISTGAVKSNELIKSTQEEYEKIASRKGFGDR